MNIHFIQQKFKICISLVKFESLWKHVVVIKTNYKEVNLKNVLFQSSRQIKLVNNAKIKPLNDIKIKHAIKISAEVPYHLWCPVTNWKDQGLISVGVFQHHKTDQKHR